MFHNSARQQYPTFPGLSNQSNLSSQVSGIGIGGQPSVASSSASSTLFHSHNSTFNSSLGQSDTGLSIFDNCSGLQDAPGMGMNTTYMQQSLAQSVTLSTATHEVLMQSGNAAYMHLYTKFLNLEAQHAGLKSTYDLLRSHYPVPPASNPYATQPSNPYPSNLYPTQHPTQHPSKPPVAALPFRDGLAAATAFVNQKFNRDDFQNVKFWYKQDWKKNEDDENDAVTMNEKEGTKGPGRVSQGINVTARFIEDADGNVLTGWRLTDLRNLSQQIFHQLLQCGVAPTQWRKITREALMYYLSEMYTSFPELRYCDSHWKASCIASRQYSGWYHSNVTNKGIKQEGAGVADPPKQKSKSLKKRPALTVETRLPKKLKPSPTPIRSASPVDLDYLDAEDFPASTFDAQEPDAHRTPEPCNSIPASTSDNPQSALVASKSHVKELEQVKTPIDLPPPSPLPTPTDLETLPVTGHGTSSFAGPAPIPQVQASGPETLAGKADNDSSAPPVQVLASEVQSSALDILADAAANNAGIDGDQLVQNPLHAVFGAPTDNANRSAAIIDADVDDAVAKGKKKDEKDQPIYPAKTTSPRNLFLIDFYADFKKKNPSEKLMKSVFDNAFNNLSKEELARYKTMASERKKAAKNANQSALAAA